MNTNVRLFRSPDIRPMNLSDIVYMTTVVERDTSPTGSIAKQLLNRESIRMRDESTIYVVKFTNGTMEYETIAQFDNVVAAIGHANRYRKTDCAQVHRLDTDSNRESLLTTRLSS